MDFNFLYKPMKLSGDNIDQRYFKDNGDGTYNATPLLIYNVARDAEKYFKRLIFQLDSDHQFQNASSIRQVKNKAEEHEHSVQFRAQYGDLLKEEGKRWKEYQEQHPDEFEVRGARVSLGGEDETRYFNAFSPDVPVSLTSAVKAYNAARELAERFVKADSKKGTPEGPERANLPFEYPLFSKAEFADAHAALRKKWAEELGIPEDNFEAGKIEKQVKAINNKKCSAVGESEENIEEFTKQLCEYLTNNTAADFKEKSKEAIKFIDEDFDVMFNEKAREFKAIKEDDSRIEVFTVVDEDETDVPEVLTQPIRIITVSKVDLNDSDETRKSGYNYRFNVELDDESFNYTKQINTKADLRKAIEITLTMTENVKHFKKYHEALKDILEKL